MRTSNLEAAATREVTEVCIEDNAAGGSKQLGEAAIVIIFPDNEFAEGDSV